MKQRIYIAGGAGMLGEAFYRQFKNDFELRVTDIDVNASWVQFLDFRDFDAYARDLRSFKPDYLFHLGAHTNLEYCEENKEDTYLTNTTSVEYAVELSNELNIPLLYISTAGIYDGNKENYTESDLPNPSGNYAISKYLAEKYVLANKKDHLICRAGWMMGGGPSKDKKFVGRIMEQLRTGKKQLNIVNDKAGTPTYTIDFAANVKSLIENNHLGLFNMACTGETSRIGIAKEVLKVLGLEDEITINPVDSTYFSRIYFAPRPNSEKLVNTRLEEINLNNMRDWRVCLREYLTEYYNNYLVQHPAMSRNLIS